LWHIALRHGLSEADAADVVQTTWLRLCEHISDVRDPERVGSWLSTTAQRESVRCVASRRRLVPSDEASLDEPDRLAAPLDEAIIAKEQAATVRAALDTLPATWRSILLLLTQDPPLSYQQIGGHLGLPVGSIGPTRGRSVRRLRAILPA
jgi:RNA polymerase sigma factor (sigma-70 family)